MKQVETAKSRNKFLAALPVEFTTPETGCVQCGSRLEPAGRGLRNQSGKCFNCAGWITDGDDPFEEPNE